MSTMSSRTTSLKLARLKRLGDDLNISMLKDFDSNFMDDPPPVHPKSRKITVSSSSSRSSDCEIVEPTSKNLLDFSTTSSNFDNDVTVINVNECNGDTTVKVRSRVHKSKSVFDFSEARVHTYLSSMSSDGSVNDAEFHGFTNPEEIEPSLKLDSDRIQNNKGTLSCKGFCQNCFVVNKQSNQKVDVMQNSFYHPNKPEEVTKDKPGLDFYPRSIRILAKTLDKTETVVKPPKPKNQLSSKLLSFSIVDRVKKRLSRFRSKAKIPKSVAKATIVKTQKASTPAKSRKPIVRIPLGVRRSKRIRKKGD